MASEKDRKKFGSFKDLARSLGGGEEAEAEDSGIGGGEAEQEDPLAGVREGVREIIASAGPAFGPMTHGPACYADLASEEMELLASFRIRTVFPPEVLEEVASLPENPDPSEWADRVDLRDRRIFTIDGDDAKDYDDAICIERLEDGRIEVGVHIADVSHYVQPGMAVDREAVARATSVYVPDQVIPMLPEKLSNGLCSLVPHRERLAFSVFMIFDDKGKRHDYRIHKSVIRSCHRCTYRIVQKVLDGVDDEETRPYAHIAEDLKLFEEWTRKQQLLRDRAGSLRMQSAERKFEFDEKHEVVRIYPSALYFSQTLIEETALAANQAVGDWFKDRDLPTIYRVHPRKDPEEIEAIVNMLAEHGMKVPNKDFLSGRDVGRLIREARRRPNAEAMIGRIMGLVERATYEVQKADDEAEHWGLARKHYLHFTSPIRRYPDLIVHRWLHDLMTRLAEAEDELLHPEQVQELCDTASHSSLQADLASMVESAIDDLKICQYMEKFEGEELMARIERVSPAGIEVFLAEHYVTGFIPAATLQGRKKVEGSRLSVVSRRGSRAFDEGEAIKIRIELVDFVRLQVSLRVAE